MDYIDNVITINDDKEYIVVKQVKLEDKIYLYIVNNKDDKDSRFVEVDNKEIRNIDPTLFQEKLLPLFLDK